MEPKTPEKQFSHYYSTEQKGDFKPRKIEERIADRDFEFWTADSVFSKDNVDFGTRLLAETLKLHDNARVLDLGCGIGVLGIVAMKTCKLSGLVMTDVNKRAIELTKMNVELNQLDKSKIVILEGDLFNPVRLALKENAKFDYIISNPPMNAGRDVCEKIIKEGLNYLKEKGKLLIVARHNKGGEHLKFVIGETFGQVEELSKAGGFRVYEGTRHEVFLKK